jgi:hypothetical protein
MMARLESTFPNLRGSVYSVESNDTVNYNCIAWAADNTQSLVAALPTRLLAFGIASRGNVGERHRRFPGSRDKPTDNNQLELGNEKVAIYVNANGTPTHMARQRIRVVDEQARSLGRHRPRHATSGSRSCLRARRSFNEKTDTFNG